MSEPKQDKDDVGGVKLLYEATERSGTYGIAYGSISAETTDKLQETARTVTTTIVDAIGATAKAMLAIHEEKVTERSKLRDEADLAKHANKVLSDELENTRKRLEKMEAELDDLKRGKKLHKDS